MPAEESRVFKNSYVLASEHTFYLLSFYKVPCPTEVKLGGDNNYIWQKHTTKWGVGDEYSQNIVSNYPITG